MRFEKHYSASVLQPTWITSHSNALIDNAYSNSIDQDIISGNLT